LLDCGVGHLRSLHLLRVGKHTPNGVCVFFRT
jgi:hypothetical protein